jgi:hypothetical protein
VKINTDTVYERERELRAPGAEQTAQKSTPSTPTHRSLRPTLSLSKLAVVHKRDILIYNLF